MSTALAIFKRDNGIATHRLAGAGHRYPWMAFFTTITMNDGTHRGFTDVAAEYSMAALIGRNKVVEREDELSACKILAERNGIPWPANEPKTRKSRP